ncbi:Syntaxin-61 [Platanthera zijinensis]|uniref:Syntaxin-61 n=1 Tax=Platanthera zijinensis TaxID=2320716 RepID=A0AAP0G7Y5_9ASPA
MTSAQDPFYIVKEEIQDSIDKLQATFHKLEQTPSETGERVRLTKELLTNCESIEWQVDELNKAITVAARNPAWYGLDEAELEKRRRWTNSAHNQVAAIRKAVEAGKAKNISLNGTPQGLMRLPNDRKNYYDTRDNDDDFIASESDRQMLLIKQQDEELDELSATVRVIGGVGLTIHEELVGQERIMDELSADMETASNRLDFVQKKVGMVLKKAGAKGQIMLIVFLLILFIILFVLVFFT